MLNSVQEFARKFNFGTNLNKNNTLYVQTVSNDSLISREFSFEPIIDYCKSLNLKTHFLTKNESNFILGPNETILVISY